MEAYFFKKIKNKNINHNLNKVGSFFPQHVPTLDTVYSAIWYFMSLWYRSNDTSYE